MNRFPNMNFLRRMFRPWAAGALAVAAAACTGDAAGTSPAGTGGASLALHVAVPATRADVSEEDYAALENRIEQLRIVLLSPKNEELYNRLFSGDDLTGAAVADGYAFTVEGLPAGSAQLYVIANEDYLGEPSLVDVPDDEGIAFKKLLVKDPKREIFPKRYSEMTAERGAALPMSAYDRDLTVGTGTNAVEIALVRAVAKLKIEMVNELTRPITVNEMSFGAFMADRFYLFQDGNLDVPGDAEYSGRSYGSQENEAERLNIVIGGGESRTLVLYIYPSYAWKDESEDSPYTIGFRTPNALYPLKAFIGGGASRNSIARNTQVRIRAVLHTDANLVLDFRVEDWAEPGDITVPPFS